MAAALVKLAGDLEVYAAEPKRNSLTLEDWNVVENTAQALANGLRSRGQTEDHHGIVGGTSLPTTLTVLLAATRGESRSSNSPQLPDALAKSAAYEILRVGANVCMDHDTNRGRLLAAEFPQTVLGVLEAYSAFLMRANQATESKDSDCAAILNIMDLNIIKTAIGAILNSSMDYKPVREALIDRKAPGAILRLSSLIYPAGRWLQPSLYGDGVDDQTLAGFWSVRSGISSWGWRAVETLRPTESDIAWDEDALPLLIKSLDIFCPQQPHSDTDSPDSWPSYHTIPTFASSKPELRYTLLSSDMTVLQEVAMLVEALTAEEERARALLLISTGKSASLSSPDSPFVHLLRFIEHGAPLPAWKNEPNDRVGQWPKTLGMCKAAIIKAIVAIAGEESQADVLWGQNDPSGGWFVEQMARWIHDYPASKESRSDEERDDLVICATLCLGNLAKGEQRCMAIINSPLNIVSLLVPLLEPSADIKLKHGVLGLFKNLAQVPPAREPLGRSGLVEAICGSKVWEREADMADIVQLSAIGITKHLVTSNILNALKLFVPIEGSETGLDQILDLIRRTDSLAVRNEATRILVNLIKTLWTPLSSSMSPVATKAPSAELPMQVIEDRRKAFDELCSEETADALAEMVGRGVKYPVLLNEGIMALTLLAGRPAGVPHIVTALTSPLGPEASAPNVTRSPPISEASTSTSLAAEGQSSATALDMVVSHILSPKGRSLPPELRANACTLLTSVGRHDVAIDRSDSEKMALVTNIREVARPVLVALANEPISQLSVSSETSSSSPPTSPAGGAGPSAASGRPPNLVRNAAVRTLTAFGTPISSPPSS